MAANYPRTPIRPEERLFLYAQSSQLRGQTGFIGHLRGDFGSEGNEFWTTWFPYKKANETVYYSRRPVVPGAFPKYADNEVVEVKNFDRPEYRFDVAREVYGYVKYASPIPAEDAARYELEANPWKAELDEIVNALRKPGAPLYTRDAMKKWHTKYMEHSFEGACTRENGLRVDTNRYSFLFRFIPVKGDYNFYCFVYVKQWLDEYIQKASNGIRFITSSYKELFRIPNGGRVRVTSGYDGKVSEYTCRYVDDYHAEIGPNLYHICEFAEMMEKAGSAVEPVTEGDESDVD